MTQLINKGGFRERANRSRKYKDSENEKTMLVSNKYQPSVKPESHLNNTSSVDIQPDSVEIKDTNP